MTAPSSAGTRPQVVLDTDIGTDVDDALALSVLLGSPEIDLVAVTTVYGDTLLRARMVTRLLALAGRRGVAVRAGLRETPAGRDIYWAGHEGSTMPGLEQEVVVDADDPAAAIRLLVDTVRGNPGRVSVLAVGPLTNIGAAITLDPVFATDVAEIVIMGGHFGALDRPPPSVEHNIKCDPESAAIVFASGAAIRVVGLDVTERTRIRAGELARIAAAGALGEELGNEVRQYWTVGSTDGNTPHDPLVALAISRPDLFTFVDADVSVLMDAPVPGATPVHTPVRGGTRVATDVRAQDAVEQIVARIERAGRGTGA
jgi:purine nucleosidase